MKKIITAAVSVWMVTGCTSTPAVDLPLSIHISANGAHSALVDAQGQVWTWGDNRFGQLGDGTTTSRTTPVIVAGLPAIADVAVGGSQTFALTRDGYIWAWGFNADNTLGVSTETTTQTTPVLVAGLDHVIDIATGDGHGVALRSDGTVWVWGINVDGQLGVGDTTYRPFPEQITQFSDVSAIAAGDYHTLILREDRTVWISNGTFSQVEGLDNIVQVSAAENFSVALDAYGDIWGFGDNSLGQLTSAAAVQQLQPVRIVGSVSGQPYRAIDAGGDYVLALDDAGNLRSWGYNGDQQLGYVTPELVSAEPQLVPILGTVSDVSAADNHALALTSDGELWLWGESSRPTIIKTF